MSDIYSKSKRSDIMSKIPSKGTQPEILVRKYLFSKGFRLRKNVKELPGKPDIVLPKYGFRYKETIYIINCPSKKKLDKNFWEIVHERKQYLFIGAAILKRHCSVFCINL